VFHIVRLVLIFVLGAATTKVIEDSPMGAFLMGSASVALTVWMIVDINTALRAIAP